MATVYYSSVSGADGNDGSTKALAVQTLTRAITLAIASSPSDLCRLGLR